MAKKNIKNLPTKKKEIESYPRVKAGKVEVVSEHTKNVHVKPELSKAAKKKVKEGSSKSLIEKDKEKKTNPHDEMIFGGAGIIVFKDKVYEKNLQDYRHFGELSYNYQGTFRTKELAVKELETRKEESMQPFELILSRIIKSPKGYRVYTRYEESLADDLLRGIVENTVGTLGSGFSEPESFYYLTRNLAEDKKKMENTMKELIAKGYVVKKVGELEILFKATKKAQKYVD